ncbi:MAG: S41 family peptidase [Planctomycetota bacterium]
MSRPNTVAAAIALTAVLAAQDDGAPVVQSLTPDHLAHGVDPKVTELVIRFDRAMDQSVHAVCGGGANLPTVAGTSWRDARTFVLTVELAPDRVYALDLSCTGSAGFRSRAGQRLEPTPWRFATAGPAIPRADAERAAGALFRLLAQQYSYYDRLGIDWEDLGARSRERLAGAGCMASLALEVANLLAVPQDPHISVGWGDATIPTFQRCAVLNYDERGVRRLLPGLEPVGRIGLAARTEDGIGYLQIGSFARGQRGDLDRCVAVLRSMRDCRGIVLDVRANAGGDEGLARRIAGFFVDGERVYAAHRVRDPRAPDGFAERQDRVLRKNPEPDTYRGPVVVLMGQFDMSSSESFLLMMQQAPRATLIGARSYGSSGNPRPYLLAPGLTVMLPSWRALRPDGTCIEGEGIEPTVPITAPARSFATGDPVLAEALARLRR